MWSFSILPAHLSGIEYWVIRICLLCALLSISTPWLIAITFDIGLYIYRFIWHYVPIYGGRAQGETRPRAPSLADSRKRRRKISLAALMNLTTQDQLREEHRGMTGRHARTMSEESVAEGEGESDGDG